MKTLAVIPARYASTRFPGKPLALLGGKPIIDYVYHTAAATEGIDRAVVATDDERILNHMHTTFGPASAMMTSSSHRSGTDRCGEVAATLAAQDEHYDVVINLQGDEPFVQPQQLQSLAQCFAQHQEVKIATLRTPIGTTDELLSPNNVKVVCAATGNALYFSRQPLPYRRGVDVGEWLAQGSYYKHVGIYAFRPDTLATLCALAPGTLEESEKLEQLRWLEAGFAIYVCDTAMANIGIDTPDDLAAAERYLQNR